MTKIKILSFLLIFIGGFSLWGIFYLSSVEAASYERLFYFREGENARKSFFAHPGSIDIFAPQSYMIDQNGYLIGKVEADLLAFAKKIKLK